MAAVLACNNHASMVEALHAAQRDNGQLTMKTAELIVKALSIVES